MAAVNVSSESDPLRTKMEAFKARQLDSFVNRMQDCMASMVAVVQTLEPQLLDLKNLCKDLDFNLQTIIDYPNRAQFVKDLKSFQGDHGTKRFDSIKLALNCSDISTISEEDLNKFRGDIVALRQRLARKSQRAAVR